MRRRVVVLLLITPLLIAAELMSWRFYARRRLALELPSMIRHTFTAAEARMHPYTRWPSQVNLVLGQGVDLSLAAKSERFQHALRPATVRVQTQDEALRTGAIAAGRCRDCVVVHYRELSNSPVYARVEVAFSGGEHPSGYTQSWVNVFGRWFHLRTELAWMT